MNRSFEVVACAQGSPEWKQARLGRVTGSVAATVMSKEGTAGKADLRLKLATERITGQQQEDGFRSRHTDHGGEMEPLARIAIEQRHGVAIYESGFLRHTQKMIGVSLDGHTKDFSGGMFEIKCPKSTTHLGYLEGGKLPAAYRWQVIHGMYVSGANWCIFGSYDERVPAGLELFTIEVKAADLPIAEYEEALDKFLASVDEMEQRLRGLQEKMNG